MGQRRLRRASAPPRRRAARRPPRASPPACSGCRCSISRERRCRGAGRRAVRRRRPSRELAEAPLQQLVQLGGQAGAIGGHLQPGTLVARLAQLRRCAPPARSAICRRERTTRPMPQIRAVTGTMTTGHETPNSTGRRRAQSSRRRAERRARAALSRRSSRAPAANANRNSRGNTMPQRTTSVPKSATWTSSAGERRAERPRAARRAATAAARSRAGRAGWPAARAGWPCVLDVRDASCTQTPSSADDGGDHARPACRSARAADVIEAIMAAARSFRKASHRRERRRSSPSIGAPARRRHPRG